MTNITKLRQTKKNKSINNNLINIELENNVQKLF